MICFSKKIRFFLRRKYYILSKPKFYFITKNKQKNQKLNILDIGCGGNSPIETKFVFPNSRYVGIDRDFNYHNNEISINTIDKKIRFDLNSNIDFLKKKLINESFDIIIFNHTIEHTYNGIEILKLVSNRLKSQGCIYIEFPSIRSLALPSMKGTLNFCDDKTHLRIYSIQEIANTLLLNDCRVLKGGKRLNLFSLFLMPIRLINCLILKKSPAGAFWDLLGFADYVFASKN